MPQPAKRFTPQEYYALEQVAEYKSDYYDGEIFAMAGGTVRHSLICSNLNRELGNQLKGSPCVVFDANLRLKIKATGLRTYPDASVYCGALQRDGDDPTGETLTNPTLLIEVLSKSTEGYDRGLKAESYRQIESLRAYVLVSQNSAHAELYEKKAENSWSLTEVRGLDGLLNLTSIGVELPLSEIYARVDFTTADPVPQA